MISLNLFPWRESRRRRIRQRLLLSLALAAISALVLAFIWQMVLKQSLTGEQQRVNYLQQQDALLSDKVKQIQDLDKQKRELLQRLTSIDQLQANRGVVAEMFNALPATLPDNVYLTSWQRNANQYTFVGKAQFNAGIAEFMRKLAATVQFQNPVLREIKAPSDITDPYSSFTLDVTLPSQAGVK